MIRTIAMTMMASLALASARAGEEPSPLSAQSVRLGSIDTYGLRTVDAKVLRDWLPLHEGDLLSQAQAEALGKRIETDPPPDPRIEHLRVAWVCCGDGRTLAVFIGVQEKGQPVLKLRQRPTGNVRLPEDLVKAEEEASRAVFNAVMQGKGTEDDSQGHSLLLDPALRAPQEKLPAFAKRDLQLLRRVLRESADDAQRAAAARVLGYAPDKQAVVDDLVYAMTDANDGVRNDAMRALSVFGRATKPIPVPYEPFIDLLYSPLWTDLNKSSFALAGLSERRDPALFALIRARALPPLAEIARWKSRGHGLLGYQVLGRLAGYPEKELIERWERGDTEPVIRKALDP